MIRSNVESVLIIPKFQIVEPNWLTLLLMRFSSTRGMTLFEEAVKFDSKWRSRKKL